MRKQAARITDSLSLPLAAMVDIVFLLLVYFLVTYRDEPPEALLAVQQAARAAQPSDAFQTGVLELELRPGQVLMQGRPRPFAEVRETLRQLGELDPGQCVVLRVQPRTRAAEVVRVLDACRGAGFTNLNLTAANTD